MAGGISGFPKRDESPYDTFGTGHSSTSISAAFGMAEAEITRIAKQAIERWPVTGLTVIHRFGKIAPGENIVLVVASSAHRQAAFDAASFLMDFLKTRAPFWKKEHRKDGTAGEWVEAKDADDKAAERW